MGNGGPFEDGKAAGRALTPCRFAAQSSRPTTIRVPRPSLGAFLLGDLSPHWLLPPLSALSPRRQEYSGPTLR